MHRQRYSGRAPIYFRGTRTTRWRKSFRLDRARGFGPTPVGTYARALLTSVHSVSMNRMYFPTSVMVGYEIESQSTEPDIHMAWPYSHASTPCTTSRTMAAGGWRAVVLLAVCASVYMSDRNDRHPGRSERTCRARPSVERAHALVAVAATAAAAAAAAADVLLRKRLQSHSVIGRQRSLDSISTNHVASALPIAIISHRL